MIAAAILAGGDGRRIGGRKPEKVLLGRPLLDWVAACARRQSDRLAVAKRGARNGDRAADICVLHDDERLAGPIAGLDSALRWAGAEGADWLLTLPCDTPFAPDDLADRLRCAANDAEASVAMARSSGALHPACALWRADLAPALRTYAASGRSSLIGFAESVGYTAVDWPDAPADPFFNVNTPEDLAEAARLAKQLGLH
jgi:molybdenum cofactor guanylyltransferase